MDHTGNKLTGKIINSPRSVKIHQHHIFVLQEMIKIRIGQFKHRTLAFQGSAKAWARKGKGNYK